MSWRAASTCGSMPCSRSVSLVIGPIDTTRASPTRPPPSRKKRTVELEVKVTWVAPASASSAAASSGSATVS